MKTLNDVVDAVQHETQLSRSQLSLRIGKSRNYLNTTVKNGLSYEKEQEIIALLLELIDDEVTMLRNVLADKEETIKEKSDEISTKNLFIDGLDMENKGLMDNIDYLNREVNLLIDEKEKLSFKIAGLEEELEKNKEGFLIASTHRDSLQRKMDELDRENKHIKVSNSMAIDAESSCKDKVRILTASIIGLVAIFSVYLWVK